MELAAAVTLDPIIWSILWALAQNVLGLIQNSPRDRISILQIPHGKVSEVSLLLGRIQQSRSIVVDATLSPILHNLKLGLSALKTEVNEVLTMTSRRYILEGKKRKENLAELVRRVDSSLTSLNTAFSLFHLEQQVEENARLSLANERLLRQVSAGGPRQDEALAARTMQQSMQESSERVGSLEPYIIPDATFPLAEENTGLVTYCKGQGEIAFAECLGTVPMPAWSPMTTTACVSFQESDLGLEQGREAAVVAIDEASSGLGSPVAFIHRDHKCDGCLTKPIVGKKFHSLHVPNYDLCEECYKRCHGTSDDFWEE